MLLDFSALGPREAYAWMVATILPRPIAWVSTVSLDGKTNLAPFSFFQGITANPPTLMISPVNDRNGGKKDTVRNLEEVDEFVVHVVPYAFAEKMNATSASLPYGESEFHAGHISTVPSHRVRPPRVPDAPVAFECTVAQIVPMGEGPLAAHVVFGRILLAHVNDAVLASDGRPDPEKLDLIGRLGRNEYTRTTHRFSMERPD